MDILSALTAARAARYRAGTAVRALSVLRCLRAARARRQPANPASAVMEERGTRQARWQELTKSECFGLLAREQLGRVAFVDDRGPMVLPVNFVLDRQMVVFRTDEGAKLDVARYGGRVAFEVDRTDAATHTGWSVVVRGEAVEVTIPGRAGAPAWAAAGPVGTRYQEPLRAHPARAADRQADLGTRRPFRPARPTTAGRPGARR